MSIRFIRNRQELEHLVIMERAGGEGIRSLAKQLGVSRNMIRRILRKHGELRDHGHDALPAKRKRPTSSKLDAFEPRMKELLAEFPDLTGERMFEELRDAGYQGGISILRERLRQVRPRPKREPEVRFETDPGQQGQMDWSPYRIRFSRTGKQEVQCFSYILGYSRRQYIDFTLRRDFYTLIRRHRDAFEYFGGNPRCCLYDGEKTIVLRREAGRPVLNPAFIAFITHYQCRPIICLPGRPKTKGKIERPFQYVEGNLLNGRTFQDLDDLKRTAQWWLANKSDPHIHDTTGRMPLELFMEEEAGRLQPLPRHPYDTAEVALRVCGFDGFLEFRTNRYSVPYAYMADILAMKITDTEVFVYGPELDLIARHERLPDGAGQTIELPAHRTCKSIRYGLEPVRESFEALGPGAEIFLAGLKGKHPRNPGFHARYILGLKVVYHSDDINRALQHAHRYRAYDAKAVERILLAKAKPRTLESFRDQRAARQLETAMPRIRQRSLDEYDRLTEEATDETTEGPGAGNTNQAAPENPEAREDGECA
jgi:transposase